MLHGGGQEGGRRSGTESVLLVAGLGAAAALARGELERGAAHMRAMRQRLLEGLQRTFPKVWAVPEGDLARGALGAQAWGDLGGGAPG